MISEIHKYSTGSREFGGYLVRPHAPRTKPAGVLVYHEGDGLNDHTRNVAENLAGLGYVAYAPDLYGETFTSRERGVAAIKALVSDSERLRARLSASLDSLANVSDVDSSRLAAIGFCFGGFAALELARSGADICCAVCFHGGLATHSPATRGDVKAKVLVCTGGNDPHVPQAQRTGFEAEMTAAGADWQMLVLGAARHGFMNENVNSVTHPGSEYNATAQARSWSAMLALFGEGLSGTEMPLLEAFEKRS